MASKVIKRLQIQALKTAAEVSADALVARVEALKLGVAQSFHEMGRCLGEILERKLHLSLGYTSFEEMLAARGLMSPMQASKLIEVSRQFSKRDAVRLGPEKAYALVRHVARTKQKDDPAEYLVEGFPVGGRRRPIDEVTVREIVDATRTAVSRQHGEHGESERARRDAESTHKKVRAALTKRTGGEAEVSVHFRHGAWRVVVDLPAELAESALI